MAVRLSPAELDEEALAVRHDALPSVKAADVLREVPAKILPKPIAGV